MRDTRDSADASVDSPDVTPAGEPLLTTRFSIPAAPPDLVVRHRLLDLVRQGVHGPLTLVSAPAGTGKTVLLASWSALGEVPGPVTWMTMEDGDERPGVFWSYVLDGLARSGVDVSGVGVPARADAVDRPLLARMAWHIAAHEEPVVLVLDDGDHLVDPTLGGDLGYLLRHCDGKLRVVLLTRVDPALPLHRYRLDGAVTEIRSAHLAFTSREAATLMRRSGLDLTAAEVAALLDRTGGWPAGLKFAAMSLAGRADSGQAIREFTGDEGDVAAYLVTEVLDAQPAEMRDVLLRTSIADRLRPGLLEALTGRSHGQRVLEFMAHANSFIQPVSGCHGWYRYQSLFREFLRAQLAYEQPELVPVLHRAAADWLAGNGCLHEAIRHAAAAGAWPEAAGYLVDDLAVGALLTGRASAGLAGLFASLPDDEESAAAAVVRAALAITASDTERCAAELGRARTHLAAEAPGRAQSCRLSIAVLEALHADLTSDVEAGLAAVTTAEDRLREAPRQAVAAHPELPALVAGCRGRLLLWRGEFGSAQTALTEAARLGEAQGCEEVLMASLGLSALLEAVNGRLRRAAELADRADAVARRSGTEAAHHSAAAAAALAWVRMEEYDVAAARDLARQAEAALSGHEDKVTTAVLALVRARLLRARGNLEGARAELRAGREPQRGYTLPGWLDRWLGAAEGALLVAEGHPDEAVGTIEALEDPDRPETVLVLQQARLARGETDAAGTPSALGRKGATPLDTQVTAWLVQAARSVETGDPARAKVALERSLRLAAPERLRRPFLEASPSVRRLLRGGSDLAARYPWLGTAGPATSTRRTGGDAGSRARPAGTEDPPDLIVEPLTNKEQEVLGHLAELLTTEEIAATMFVSVNTVRTHVRSILRKLGASRRNEAVRRGRDLHLLPTTADAVPAQRTAPPQTGRALVG